MVTTIVDGFLHVTQVGGVDARVLPGQLVTVHGRKELPGVIVQPPAHLLPPDERSEHGERNRPVALANLLVDTGLAAQEVGRLVRVGDLVSFAQAPIELGKDALAGHTLDNRASVAALTACLEHLQKRQLDWDLWAVATTQEEESLGGAATSALPRKSADGKCATIVSAIFGGGILAVLARTSATLLA